MIIEKLVYSDSELFSIRGPGSIYNIEKSAGFSLFFFTLNKRLKVNSVLDCEQFD